MGEMSIEGKDGPFPTLRCGLSAGIKIFYGIPLCGIAQTAACITATIDLARIHWLTCLTLTVLVMHLSTSTRRGPWPPTGVPNAAKALWKQVRVSQRINRLIEELPYECECKFWQVRCGTCTARFGQLRGHSRP